MAVTVGLACTQQHKACIAPQTKANNRESATHSSRPCRRCSDIEHQSEKQQRNAYEGARAAGCHKSTLLTAAKCNDNQFQLGHIIYTKHEQRFPERTACITQITDGIKEGVKIHQQNCKSAQMNGTAAEERTESTQLLTNTCNDTIPCSRDIAVP